MRKLLEWTPSEPVQRSVRSLGIALFCLVVGVAGALWLYSDRPPEIVEPELASVSPLPPAGAEIDAVHHELLTSLASMRARIAELEREALLAKREKATADQPVVSEPEAEEVTDDLPLPVAEAEEPPQLASGREPIEFDFNEPLDPYGEWWDTPDYGRVWQPDIGAAGGDWAPYTEGDWEYTDVGWNFVSEEPWGWATYHYGRWASFDRLGWCWVPGNEWAPAWVSWRVGSSHVGWAPLPPEACWNERGGIGKWVDTLCDIGPARYCFMPVKHFGKGNCARSIVDRSQNAHLVLTSRNLTNLHRRVGGHGHGQLAICNLGPDPEWIGRGGGRKFQRLEIVAGSGTTIRKSLVDPARSRLHVRTAERVAAEQSRSQRVVQRPSFEPRTDRGWANISNSETEARVRRYLVAEASGKAPAVSAIPVVRQPVKRLNISTADPPMVAQVEARVPEVAVDPLEMERERRAEMVERRRIELEDASERANQQRLTDIRRLENQRLATDRARAESLERRMIAEREAAIERERQRVASVEIQRVERQRREAEYVQAERAKKAEADRRRALAEQQRATQARREIAAYQRSVEEQRRSRAESASAHRRQEELATALRRKQAEVVRQTESRQRASAKATPTQVNRQRPSSARTQPSARTRPSAVAKPTVRTQPTVRTTPSRPAQMPQRAQIKSSGRARR